MSRVKNEVGGCEKCPATIRWIQMLKKDGKLGAVAPLDFLPSAKGNITIEDHPQHGRIGRVLTGDDLAKAHALAMPLHINHFATCPKAEHFRR